MSTSLACPDTARVCKACHQTFPLTEFYLCGKAKLPDTSCKECRKAKIREWKEKDPNYADRKREWTRTWYANHPHKRAAHKSVEKALRIGLLAKPSACEVCGTSGSLEAHHDDYSRPLDVQWTCIPCHAAAHTEKRGATK
jgi:hypothetical protein